MQYRNSWRCPRELKKQEDMPHRSLLTFVTDVALERMGFEKEHLKKKLDQDDISG